jgi:hypothetical protein
VNVELGKVTILASRKVLGEALGLVVAEGEEAFVIPMIKVRNGKARRLVLSDRGQTARPLKNNLITLLENAELAKRLVDGSPNLSLAEIAARHGRCATYLQRLYKVAHLAPALRIAIYEGQEPDSLTSRLLLLAELPVGWRNQAGTLAFVQ